MQSLSIIWEVKDFVSGTRVYSSSLDITPDSNGSFSLTYPISHVVPNGEVEITEVRVQDIYGNVTILSTPDQADPLATVALESMDLKFNPESGQPEIHIFGNIAKAFDFEAVTLTLNTPGTETYQFAASPSDITEAGNFRLVVPEHFVKEILDDYIVAYEGSFNPVPISIAVSDITLTD